MTIGNSKENYIKYDSSVEELPSTMPITGDAIEAGTFAYDTYTGNLYARMSNGTWKAQ